MVGSSICSQSLDVCFGAGINQKLSAAENEQHISLVFQEALFFRKFWWTFKAYNADWLLSFEWKLIRNKIWLEREKQRDDPLAATSMRFTKQRQGIFEQCELDLIVGKAKLLETRVWHISDDILNILLDCLGEWGSEERHIVGLWWKRGIHVLPWLTSSSNADWEPGTELAKAHVEWIMPLERHNVTRERLSYVYSAQTRV